MTDPAPHSTRPAETNGGPPERTLTISWEDPVESAMKLAGMSGLEAIRGDRRRRAAGAADRAAARLRPEVVEEGHVIFGAPPGEQHYNPIGVVHGGLAATLLDSAMGCAVQTTLAQGEAYTTLELKVNFVRAITRDTGRVLAEATVIHRGGRVATAEGRDGRRGQRQAARRTRRPPAW